jgi:hypothetical protein
MFANDQIKIVARQICREADERIHRDDDRFDRQQLWDTVRHACRAIQAVTEIESDDMDVHDRSRRAQFLVSELESALEAAKRAKAVLEWSARRQDDLDF